MLGKVTDTILAQIEKLENESKELKAAIDYEKSLQIDYTYSDIRKWLLHFRDLDYSKPKNRRDLIDTLIYRVVLYDDNMKIILHLKGGQQKSDLLLSLLYPDYRGGNGGNNDPSGGGSTPENEKNDTEVSSDSSRSSYTSRLVETNRIELSTS